MLVLAYKPGSWITIRHRGEEMRFLIEPQFEQHDKIVYDAPHSFEIMREGLVSEAANRG